MAPKTKPQTKDLPAKPLDREETTQVKGGKSRSERLASNHSQTLR